MAINNSTRWRFLVQVGVILGFCVLCLSAGAGDEVLGNLVLATRTTVDGIQAINGTTVFSGTELATQEEGRSLMMSLTGDRISVGPQTRFKIEGEKQKIRLELRRGRIGLDASSVEIRWFGVIIAPPPEESAVWEVALVEEKMAEISVVRGTINARSRGQTIVVPEGQRVLIIPESKEWYRWLLGLPARVGGASALIIPLALADDEKEVVSPSEPE